MEGVEGGIKQQQQQAETVEYDIGMEKVLRAESAMSHYGRNGNSGI